MAVSRVSQRGADVRSHHRHRKFTYKPQKPMLFPAWSGFKPQGPVVPARAGSCQSNLVTNPKHKIRRPRLLCLPGCQVMNIDSHRKVFWRAITFGVMSPVTLCTSRETGGLFMIAVEAFKNQRKAFYGTEIFSEYRRAFSGKRIDRAKDPFHEWS